MSEISDSKRILFVFGTRPEAIKLAPIIREVESIPQFESFTCATAQHREMLDQVLETFDILPDYDLDIMQSYQSPLEVAGFIFKFLLPVLEEVDPDWVVVQGDTTTAFASAWTAFHFGCRVAHVEAGLRTGDIYKPFPEEMNRKLIGSLASAHFAPTEKAFKNLVNEGVARDNIHLVGNTVVDALQEILGMDARYADSRLEDMEGRVVVVTAHRRENYGPPLAGICRSLVTLADTIADINIVFSVHLNPVVRETVEKIIGSHPRILLSEPLDYVSFVHLMKRADLILTDSGGIQEEVPSLGTPALVMRSVTERPEACECGLARLVGTDETKIVSEATRLLTGGDGLPEVVENPFGDGMSSKRICEVLISLSETAGPTTRVAAGERTPFPMP